MFFKIIFYIVSFFIISKVSSCYTTDLELEWNVACYTRKNRSLRKGI